MTREETLPTAHQLPEGLSKQANEIIRMMELQIFKVGVFELREKAVEDAAKGLLTDDELKQIEAASKRIASSKPSLPQG